MAADTQDRYQSASEMAADLNRWLTRQQSWKWRLSLLAVLLICALVIASVLAWSLVRGEEPAQPSPAPKPAAARLLLERSPRKDFGLEFEVAGFAPGVDSLTLIDGQRLAIQVKSEIDCYVGVWYVDSAGGVTQLFPNQHEQDHFLAAGNVRTIPDGDQYAIRVQAAEGPEYLYAAATTRPWPSGAGIELGPAVVFASPEQLRPFLDDVGSVSIISEHSPRVAEEVIPVAAGIWSLRSGLYWSQRCWRPRMALRLSSLNESLRGNRRSKHCSVRVQRAGKPMQRASTIWPCGTCRRPPASRERCGAGSTRIT